ncbi:MAG TPA: hypothetical protein VF461_23870 [Gemmatimonadaceae bacterium]
MREVRLSCALAWASVLVCGAPAALRAQSAPCAAPAAPAHEWVRLCAGGNGIARLQHVVELPSGAMTVGDAIREIARRGGVDVTLDASLPAVGERVTLTGGRRSVAEALLLVVDGRGLEIDVGVEGGLIVVAAPTTDSRAASARVTSDSVLRAVRLSRIVVSATPNREGLFGAAPLVGMQTVGARELGLAPGFFGTDVLRNARLLPGLSARNDYSTALNVRGGESDQAIVTLDGIPLYHPFHLGGLLSSFIEPAVSRMDMFTGVFPARYGGHLSGVLDVRSAEEPRSGVHGTADLNLLSSSAAFGGTTRSGSTSWLVAGRRTYADVVAALVGQNLPYHFEDANLHLSHRFGGGSRLELTAYDDQDVVDYRRGPDTVLMSAGNRAVGVSWSRTMQHVPPALALFGGSAAVEQRASITDYHSSGYQDGAELTGSSGVRDVRIAGALSLFDSTTRHTLGYELARQQIDRDVAFSPSVPEARNFVPLGRSAGELRSAALWYEARRQVTSGLSVEAGARGDVVAGIGGALLSPRVSARLALDPSTTVTAAVGRHAQWMHSMLPEEIPIRLLDFWVASDSALPPSRAWVYTLGLERRLDAWRDLHVELFHKQLSGLVAPDALGDTLSTGEAIGIEHGRSSGAEILLRQAEHNGFAGWLSYSFSLSRRTDASGFSYTPAQDRRHELNLVGSWRTSRYLFGARFGLSSGTPYTNVEGVYHRQRYDPLFDDWSEDAQGGSRQYLLGPRNGEHYPLAHRLDVSLTRIGRDGTARLTPYLSIANVYGALNPAIYTFNYTGTPRERTGASNFRFLPTFGIRYVF